MWFLQLPLSVGLCPSPTGAPAMDAPPATHDYVLVIVISFGSFFVAWFARKGNVISYKPSQLLPHSINSIHSPSPSFLI